MFTGKRNATKLSVLYILYVLHRDYQDLFYMPGSNRKPDKRGMTPYQMSLVLVGITSNNCLRVVGRRYARWRYIDDIRYYNTIRDGQLISHVPEHTHAYVLTKHGSEYLARYQKTPSLNMTDLTNRMRKLLGPASQPVAANRQAV